MDGERLQPALARLRQHLSQPLTLAVLAAAAVILGLSGPFGTFEAMPLPARLGYWAVVVAATWSVGALASDMLSARAKHLPTLARVPLVAAGVTVAVALVLEVVALAVGSWPQSPRAWAASVGGVYVICLAIEVVGEVAARGAPPAPPQSPALLSRLPFDRRGDLLALAVSDHYVTITTTKGREMLLLRLSDAIAETAPTPGLRVHRSHWVARAAIAAVRRQGDGAVVTLTTGDTVPVSRGYLPAVMAEGLLPRGRS